jgi:multicomponent Na+:H+ antiporter subunit C
VSVSLVLVIVMAVLYACAVYLLLERSLTRVLIGFLLAGNATNLLLLIMAGRAGEPAFVADGVTAEDMTDPLPQALILTAIVITFAVSAFLLALIYRSWRLSKEDNLEDDEADVAMRLGETGVPEVEIPASVLDTEFGEADADAASAPGRTTEAGTP